MSHPYDASTKFLLQTRMADWLPLCGHATSSPVEVVDADLATVTAAADRILRVHDDPPWLLHLELQSSRDPGFVPNLPVYNVLLERRHGLPVRTVAVLLRRSADATELNGVVQKEFRGEPPYLVFRYQVVRVWNLPVETILNGGLGILPLAPLSAVTESDLPSVIATMQSRIAAEATPDEGGTLWTAADVLMGLRYPQALVAQLLGGVHSMKESVTYQAIVEEGKVLGKVQARQEDLLRLGHRRFGAPTQFAETTLRNEIDLGRLDHLVDRLLDASSWEELLAVP